MNILRSPIVVNETTSMSFPVEMSIDVLTDQGQSWSERFV